MTKLPVHGALHLRFEHQPAIARTTLRVSKQTPPLRVIRAVALPDGSALAHLHNLSGGVLGGDLLELDVTVAANAHAQLTTPGATRIYQHRDGFPDAEQRTAITVEAGGVLEYLPDQIIPFRQARYRQSTEVHLASDAGLFYWETIAPGRLAYGEQFSYDYFENSLAIDAEGHPIALERYKLCPQSATLTSLTRLGGYLYHTTFYICRVGIPESEWLALEAELTGITCEYTDFSTVVWGVSTLPTEGIVIRGFTMTYRDLFAQLTHFWSTARRRLYGMEIITPRKTY